MGRQFFLFVLLPFTLVSGQVLDDHFTNGILLENDGTGQGWIIQSQGPSWTEHVENGTKSTESNVTKN